MTPLTLLLLPLPPLLLYLFRFGLNEDLLLLVASTLFFSLLTRKGGGVIAAYFQSAVEEAHHRFGELLLLRLARLAGWARFGFQLSVPLCLVTDRLLRVVGFVLLRSKPASLPLRIRLATRRFDSVTSIRPDLLVSPLPRVGAELGELSGQLA